MDHRNIQEENAYQKELAQGEQQYDDMVTIDGHPFRIPYKIIKEVTFTGVSKEQLKSLEYAGRLQYRLMLLESVIRAKVEYTKQTITITYNPKSAHNRKEKITQEELIEFIDKEGVHLSSVPRTERDFDYVKEMYTYQFNPPSIRERPPYGYTMEEWRGMKGEYTEKMEESKKAGQDKFKAWQESYADTHPEILAQHVVKKAYVKPTLMERIFGRKQKKGGDKGYWFHGA